LSAIVTLETLAPGDDLSDAIAIRRAVFMDEQGVSEEEELDGHDAGRFHLLARVDDRPVGTLRLWDKGEDLKVQRVAVLQAARGLGIGHRLMLAAIERARIDGKTRVVLDSQVTALPFYQRLGFVADDPMFLDAGIEHRHMALVL